MTFWTCPLQTIFPAFLAFVVYKVVLFFIFKPFRQRKSKQGSIFDFLLFFFMSQPHLLCGGTSFPILHRQLGRHFFAEGSEVEQKDPTRTPPSRTTSAGKPNQKPVTPKL
eukprot:EG_transcript_22800